MIPIVITTRNRVEFLDTTLRSLSASNLPDDVPVWVVDDKSYREEHVRYLTTNDTFDLENKFVWPKQTGDPDVVVPPEGRGVDESLPDAVKFNLPRLQLVAPNWDYRVGKIPDLTTVTGINGKVFMHVNNAPQGVVTSSMRALGQAFYRYPDADVVMLLQDDIIVKSNFYQNMTTAAGVMDADTDIGIVAGMTLRQWSIPKTTPAGLYPIARWVTAQMYLIHRRVYEAATHMFTKYYKIYKNFDVKLCQFVRRHLGMTVKLVRPGQAQHIGIDSAVRRHIRDKTTRIDYGAKAPFAQGTEVRDFTANSVSTTRT